MSKTTGSKGATAGWLLALAGAVALGTLAFGVLSSGYRRERLLSLLQGEAGVDGIGLQNWLLLMSPLFIMGVGVALIAVSGHRSSLEANS